MKKTIIMAVLLTVISAATFASTGTTELSTTSKFQVVGNTDSRYDLYYVSENVDNVVVRILDKNGKLVNTDKIVSVKAFKRTYNFTELPAGTYKIEVKNGEGKASQSIFYNPALPTSLHSIVGKLPHQNKFKVFVAPSADNEKVEVKIIDDNGQVLTKEFISAQTGFSKIYNLEQINASSVTFYISNGKNSDIYTRNLR